MNTRLTKLWFWLYAAAVAGCMIVAVTAAEPQIKISVNGDQVILIVHSTVRFKVWSTVNLMAMWWPVYTSPNPPAGGEIVWVAIGNKAGLFPNWCFWKVTAAKLPVDTAQR